MLTPQSTLDFQSNAASNEPITCDISFLDNTKWEVNISILKSDNQTTLPCLRFLVVWSEITLDEKLNSCSKRQAFNLIFLPSSLSSDHDSVIICWSLERWSQEWVCNGFIGGVLARNLRVVKVHFMQSWVNFGILLKEYSVILTTYFYGMNQKIQTKKLISKISVDSNFTFRSYEWLCVFHCFHRLLCWIKSRVRAFLQKLLLFHTEKISALFLWGCVLLRGELRKYVKNSNFEHFQSTLYSTSGSMPLKVFK